MRSDCQHERFHELRSTGVPPYWTLLLNIVGFNFSCCLVLIALLGFCCNFKRSDFCHQWLAKTKTGLLILAYTLPVQRGTDMSEKDNIFELFKIPQINIAYRLKLKSASWIGGALEHNYCPNPICHFRLLLKNKTQIKGVNAHYSVWTWIYVLIERMGLLKYSSQLCCLTKCIKCRLMLIGHLLRPHCHYNFLETALLCLMMAIWVDRNYSNAWSFTKRLAF